MPPQGPALTISSKSYHLPKADLLTPSAEDWGFNRQVFLGDRNIQFLALHVFQLLFKVPFSSGKGFFIWKFTKKLIDKKTKRDFRYTNHESFKRT